MKIKREWQDEPELFGLIAEALEHGDFGDEHELGVQARDERGPYGDQGTITLRFGGKTFALDLHEIVY